MRYREGGCSETEGEGFKKPEGRLVLVPFHFRIEIGSVLGFAKTIVADEPS